jgi:hypothetical protein
VICPVKDFRVARRGIASRKNWKGGSACQLHRERLFGPEDHWLGRHHLQSRRSKKDSSCLKNRKGGRACRRRLGRHYKSVVTIERAGRTLATFSVDTIFKVGGVRRISPILTIGKVVVPVDVDLVGTTRVLLRSRGQEGRLPPFRSTQSSK